MPHDEEEGQEQQKAKEPVPASGGLLSGVGWALTPLWNLMASLRGKAAEIEADEPIVDKVDKVDKIDKVDKVEEEEEEEEEENLVAKKSRKKKKRASVATGSAVVGAGTPPPTPVKKAAVRPKDVIDNGAYNDGQVRPCIRKATTAMAFPKNAPHVVPIQTAIDGIVARADAGLELTTLKQQMDHYKTLTPDANRLAEKVTAGWGWTAYSTTKKSPTSWLANWGLSAGAKTYILDVTSGAGKAAHATVNIADLGTTDIAENNALLNTIVTSHHVTLEDTGTRNHEDNPHVYYSGSRFTKWKKGGTEQAGRYDAAADKGSTFFLKHLKDKATATQTAAATAAATRQGERADAPS